MQIISTASLVGSILTRNSSKVLNVLKELTLGTDAETWIKFFKCDRKEIKKVQAHYNGMSEGELGNTIAIADLKNIF